MRNCGRLVDERGLLWKSFVINVNIPVLETVVNTPGSCFVLSHTGHVRLLETTKVCAEIMEIGLNQRRTNEGTNNYRNVGR